MIDLVLVLLLVGGFMIGLRRGLILQIVHLTSFIVSLIVACIFFDDLAPHLKLWIPYPNLGDGVGIFMSVLNVEDIYYRGIAFAILFFGTKIAMHIIGSILNVFMSFPILRTINRWLGGALGFLEIYLLIFIVLFVAAIIPHDSIQHAVQHSLVAQLMIKHTPFFSEYLQQLWINV